MLVNMWEFDTAYSCEVLTLVVFGWSVLTLCPIRIQIIYWQKYSGSSMKFMYQYDEQS